jgi:putative ABC transport system permease protein
MIKNYFKVAIRNLLRNRVFSFINIMGLAVGMTACFLIFQYVRFESSYDSFHSHADRIYRVVGDIKTPTETVSTGLTVTPIAPNLKKDFPEIEDAVRLSRDGILVHRGNIKYQEKATVFADSSFFKIFDFPLLSGDKRTALTEPMSIVLSQTAAKKYFGNTNPLGKNIRITGAALNATITGIMKDIPNNSQIQADMLVSMSSWKPVYGYPMQDSEWTNHNFYTYVLLQPHTDAKSFEKKLPGFMQRHHGAEADKLQMWETLSLEPLRDVYLKSTRDGFIQGNIHNVYIFSIVAAFILIIACINFINLTTARSTVRAKEVGVRKVIGAARSQLAGQFIGESVIICWMSFLLTLILGSLTLPLFNQLAGKVISPGLFSKGADILGLFLLSTLIGIIAGIYPSLVLSAFRPVSVLKGRFATSTQGLLLRKGLVVFQFTISIVFIVGTIIVNSQLQYMRNKDLGFSKEQEMVIFTNYDKNRDIFKQSLSSIAGVLSTCYSSDVPGGGRNSAYSTVENKKGEMQQTNLDGFFIDYDFIRQYGLQVVAGRAFSKEFPTDSTQAMIINESAVIMLGYASPQETIGRKFSQWGRTGKIIGVVKNFNYTTLRYNIQPFTLRIEPSGFGTISIKVATTNLPATIKAIENTWDRAIPNRPFEYSFLDDKFNHQFDTDSRFGSLFLNFSILAIFISCMGVLGLASYSTFQRTKEIGVRKVLGASVSNIVRLLSTEFIMLVLLAFLIASPIGWYVMHNWLHGFAYSVPITWRVFALAGGLALLIVFLTISYQAIKAAVANPVKSLRTE